MGGSSSANSMAVMPTAQISHRWLYPPFFSTAATSGAILDRGSQMILTITFVFFVFFSASRFFFYQALSTKLYVNTIILIISVYCETSDRMLDV